MRSSHSLDLLDTAFDGTQLVADAGLLLPATLAQHLGLRELVNEQQNDYRHPRFIATVPGEGYRFIPTFSNAGWGGTLDPGERPPA